jgi:cell division protease FtsH
MAFIRVEINNMMIEDCKEKARRLLINGGVHNSSLLRDVYRMEDRDLGDSAKLSAIIKKSEERNTKTSIFNEFLKAGVLDQVINAKIFPKYKKPLIAVSSSKILNERFDVKQKMWFDYSGFVEQVQNEEVSISLDKSLNTLVKGFVFLQDKKDQKKYIFGIDFVEGWNSGYIAMYSKEKDSVSASEVMKEIINDAKKNNFFKGAKIDPWGKFIKTDALTIDDVIIKDDVKRRIVSGTIDMFNNIDTYTKNNIPIKRGILMEGLPGTGKTLLSKALCNQIKSTFIWVTADDVKYPENVSAIYDMARELVPTIVLFEDIDYIGKSRIGGRETLGGGSYDKITGELLNQMDGVESNVGIITLASSNYPKALDKALRNRPGRFDIRVRFELPDEDLREKMLVKFFEKNDISEIDIKKIVKITDKYTGAYLKELVLSTVMLAIEDKSMDSEKKAIIKDSHLKEAFSQIEASRKLDDVMEDE